MPQCVLVTSVERLYMENYFNSPQYAEDCRGDGIALGLQKGRSEGLEQGRDEGRRAGYTEGYNNGWNQSAEISNATIQEGNALLQQQAQENATLQEQLRMQSDLIAALGIKIASLEEENTKLRANDSTMRTLVNGLKEANLRAQKAVEVLNKSVVQQDVAHAKQIKQEREHIARSFVFMNAVRGVLEELTKDRTPGANHIRKMFAERYTGEVLDAVKTGRINGRPEEFFAAAHPHTRKFIASMLDSIAQAPAPARTPARMPAIMTGYGPKSASMQARHGVGSAASEPSCF
jgi:hypothetical protein